MLDNYSLKGIYKAAAPAPKSAQEAMLSLLCEDMNLNWASYYGLDIISKEVTAFSTSSAEWRSLYISKGYVRKDPITRTAFVSEEPVLWRDLDTIPLASEILSAGEVYGIPRMGVSMRDTYKDEYVGILSVAWEEKSQDEWDAKFLSIKPKLQNFLTVFQDINRELSEGFGQLNADGLTAREVEILQWLAGGRSQERIGRSLDISPRTVEAHIKSIRSKLGAASTAQAIARAVSLRVVVAL